MTDKVDLPDLDQTIDLQSLLEEEHQLHQTMVFTQEDIKKLRKRNAQPIDSDYFEREQQQEPLLTASFEREQKEVSFDQEVHASTLSEEAKQEVVPAVTLPYTTETVDEEEEQQQVSSSDEWLEEVDPVVSVEPSVGMEQAVTPAPQAVVEVSDEENPFVYRSKVVKPEPTEAKAVKGIKLPQMKGGLKWDFRALHEDHYDVEQIEPMTAYSQFDTTEPTQPSKPAASLWQQLKDKLDKSSAETDSSAETVREEGMEPAGDSGTGEIDASELPVLEVAPSVETSPLVAKQVRLERAAAHQDHTVDDLLPLVDDIVADDELADDKTVTPQAELEASVATQVEQDLSDQPVRVTSELPEVDAPADKESGDHPSLSERATTFWQKSWQQLKDVSHSAQHLEEKVHDKSVELAEHVVEDLEETRVLSQEQIRAYSDELAEATQVFTEPILTDQVLEEFLNEDDVTINAELHEKQSIAKGATWLAIGNMVSRILGAIYIIPWAAWLGAEYTTSNILYAAGYTPYALFLAVSTAGFPSAIAKQVAYHHSRKEYKMASRLFKYSLMIMSVMGLVSALLMFISAPLIIQHSAVEDVAAGVAVVRSLVPALLILPVMSLLRGYFQGFNDMMPTAVSQILEQIARVGYMLVTTYAITQIMHGSASTAVVHSTFAAFIGAVVSLAYLIFVYLRYLPMIKGLMAEDQTVEELPLGSALRVMLKDSIPFILLGSGIIIAQAIDQFTLQPILRMTTSLLDTEIGELFGVINLDTNKLIMIIISLAIGISMSSLPAITKRHAEGDKKATGELIEHTTLLFSIVMLPAAIGMASIAKPVYQMFYANGSHYGPELLVTASYMSIVLGAYTIFSTVVQAMDFRRKSMKYLLGGLLVKLALQFPFLFWMQAHGALLATAIGFGVSTAFMWRRIHRSVTIQYVELLPQLAKIMVATLIMGITTYFWSQALAGLLGDVGRLMTFVKVFLIVIVGVAIYGVILGLCGLLHLLIGKRYQALQDKMRLF